MKPLFALHKWEAVNQSTIDLHVFSCALRQESQAFVLVTTLRDRWLTLNPLEMASRRILRVCAVR
jgi:hypothetical protein